MIYIYIYSDIGYIFEATIRYPEKIHGKNKDLPFLLQKERLINVKNSYVI